MPARLADALHNARQLGLDRLDAQLLLLHALGRPDSDRAWLLTHDDQPLTETAAETFGQLCQRRTSGEPLAYIVGHKEFFGLLFKVNKHVLVPRPDTETLVQWSLDLLVSLAGLPTQERPMRVLDLGTGSGAIALSIASHLKTTSQPATVVAVDSSADALTVARENTARFGLEEQVQLVSSNWMENVSGHFDLIASNPPYIKNADPHLAALMFEPQQALTAGTDGLDDIRHIIEQTPSHLQPGGWLLLEHGYDQADEVCALLTGRGFGQVQVRFDLAGIARCSGGQWLNPEMTG